jgi:hypothetical protein
MIFDKSGKSSTATARMLALPRTASHWTRLAGLLSWDLRAFFAGFGQADGDGLFAALYATALTTFAGAQRAALSSAHSAGDGLARSLTVPAARP